MAKKNIFFKWGLNGLETNGSYLKMSVVAFDIQKEDLVSLNRFDERRTTLWVDKLKSSVINGLFEKFKTQVVFLESQCLKQGGPWILTDSSEWTRIVIEYVILWLLERMYFDIRNLDNIYLMHLLKSPLGAVPQNFLMLMIGFQNDEMVRFFLNTYVIEHKLHLDVNAIDQVSSYERCMREFPLRLQTPLTACILNMKEKSICRMKKNDEKDTTDDVSDASLRIFQNMLELCADLDLDQENGMGWTPLCLAIKQRLWNVVDVLLKRGCSAQKNSLIFGNAVSPLFLANEQGNMYLVDKLTILDIEPMIEIKELILMEVVRNKDIFSLNTIFGFHEKNKKDGWMIDFNFRDASGYSVFDIALMNDFIVIFMKLIELNFEQHRYNKIDFMYNVRKGDLNGNTLLHTLATKLNACQKGDIFVSWNYPILLKRIFDLLILRHMKETNFPMDDSTMKEYFLGTIEFSQYQDFFQDEIKDFCNSFNARGESCIHILSELEGSLHLGPNAIGLDVHRQIFALLVELYHGDFNLCNQQPQIWNGPSTYSKSMGRNALMSAIQNQNAWMFRYLLQTHGPRINLMAVDCYGNSLLHIVYQNGYYVISRNTNVDARVSLLQNILALWKEREDTFDLLNWQNQLKKTVLHLIAEQTRAYDDDLVQLFEKYKPRYDIQDKYGNTPLMSAIKHGKYDRRHLLFLSCDANLHLIDGMHSNIFHILAHYLFGDHSIVLAQTLMRNSSIQELDLVLNKRDLDGNMPLSFACRRNNEGLCLEFLKNGAHWYGKNNLRHDVLSYANEDLKAVLFEQHVWEAQMSIFSEGLTFLRKNKSLIRFLDQDIVNIIFNIGKKHFFRAGSI